MCGEAAFSGVRKNILILLVCLSALAAGCPSGPSSVVPKENMREYVHKNGLTVKLSEKFSAVETGEGFTVEPADGSNKNVRYPVQARLALQIKVPEWENAEQKTVGNRTINYRTEKQEGGSGGAEYTFSAYEQTGDAYIYYEQREQSKDAAPQFNLCWSIIENTSLRK